MKRCTKKNQDIVVISSYILRMKLNLPKPRGAN